MTLIIKVTRCRTVTLLAIHFMEPQGYPQSLKTGWQLYGNHTLLHISCQMPIGDTIRFSHSLNISTKNHLNIIQQSPLSSPKWTLVRFQKRKNVFTLPPCPSHLSSSHRLMDIVHDYTSTRVHTHRQGFYYIISVKRNCYVLETVRAGTHTATSVIRRPYGSCRIKK
jgi:hypothetical protein